MGQGSGRGSAVRSRGGWRLALAVGLALCTLGTAAAKKRKAEAGVQSPAIEALIDARGAEIRECVLTNGIYKGASAIDLHAEILTNREGHVVGCKVTATADGGDKKAVETCLAGILQRMVFPTNASALSRIIRTWHFATK